LRPPVPTRAIDKAAAAIKDAATLHVFAGPLTGSGTNFDGSTATIDLKAGEWFHESETQSARPTGTLSSPASTSSAAKESIE
jgi:hypothetical protein